MSYQVLARKYRPQRFSDVIGQQHATVTLMNALTQGRVAHGYIFSGHRGIGKTTVARILAMALNCRRPIGGEQRPTAEPCGTCESCSEVRAGNSVDVIEIDAATNRGIDEIRELRDAARYRPARDKFKIYILDEAHQITDAAFNALLKTLEEPPEHIVFMLATTQPEDIPQTVRSRCQHFSFRAVSFFDIAATLRSIAANEGIEASEAALSLLAEAGDGSVRDALSVMDQAIASAPSSSGHVALDVSQIREMLGTISNVVFERMLEAIQAARPADLMITANELLHAGNSPIQLMRQFARYLRNTLLAKLASGTRGEISEGGAALLQISDDEQRRVARSAAAFSEEELTRFLQIILRTFDELGYRQEPRLHLELGLIKLLQLRRLLPLEELLSQLPAPASREPASSSAVATPVSLAASSPVPPVPLVSSAERTKLSGTAVSNEGQSVRPDSEAPRKPSPEVESDHTEPEASASQGHTPETEPTGDSAAQESLNLVAVQQQVLAALASAKGFSSAADALAEAEWSVHGDEIRAQTVLSAKMLDVVVNAAAQALIKQALPRVSAQPLRFQALPVSAPGANRPRPVSNRAARAGSAESRAQQHPIVQEAQRLFNAEIRNVIDLSTPK